MNEPIRAFRADSRTVVRELGFLRDRWPPVDLPHAQIHLLLELAAHGVLRPSELADRLLTDPAAISRALRALAERGLVEVADDPHDKRQRRVSLAAAGAAVVAQIDAAADAQVEGALSLLSADDRAAVLRGVRAYARALVRARRRAGLRLRPIQAGDDPQVMAIIQRVMPEFGAGGPGFAIHDPEVRAMSAAYPGGAARYVVIEGEGGTILGGGGFAPLAGGEPGVCELRKMYFLPELRGLGLGAALLGRLLDEAREAGFRACYLETLDGMVRARRLYEAFGFRRLDGPLGATGHFGCDAWYWREL